MHQLMQCSIVKDLLAPLQEKELQFHVFEGSSI